jgi:hypothetical protein
MRRVQGRKDEGTRDNRERQGIVQLRHKNLPTGAELPAEFPVNAAPGQDGPAVGWSRRRAKKAAGLAAVVSEEAAADWDARCRQLAIGQNVQFLCRPFQGARPTEAQWFALIAGLEALHRQEALDLVVLDTLATLLPGSAETCAAKTLLSAITG